MELLMTRILHTGVYVLFAAAIVAPFAPALAQTPNAMPLQLETKIPLGEVKGRIDHMTIDLPRQRVFVAELGNDGVSVVDLKEGKVVHRLTGFKEPQGVQYVPTLDTLYVSNGGGGAVRLFNAGDYSEAGRIELGDDADNIRLDGAGQRLYVGYGSGGLAVIDTVKKQKIADIKLKAHPESFQLSPTRQIFVNVPRAREIAVIDQAAGKQTASWHMNQGGNFPMALNEAAQEVLVVFRTPARLGVFGMADGRAIGTLETCGDADDVFVDAKRHRVYVACGAGSVDVFEPEANGYRRIARVPTVVGARTALFIPDLDRLVVAARATASAPASLWVFSPIP
jgi:DNA-binding beta-propeller fold protein YncE